MNFLSCHGPLGGRSSGTADSQRKRTEDTCVEETPKKKNIHKWQEVTKDNKAFISNSAGETESEGHTGWALHPEGRRSSVGCFQTAEKADHPNPSVHHPSISPASEEGAERWRDLTTTALQTRTQTSLLTWDKKTAIGEIITHGLQSHLKGKWHHIQL